MKRVPRTKLQLKGAVQMTRLELIQAVGHVCEKLSKPLSSEEMDQGWSEASRVHFLELFRNLESDLNGNLDVPYFPIGRNLDHWGISGGKLLDEACEISVALNERTW